MTKTILIRIISLVVIGVVVVAVAIYFLTAPEKETTGVQNVEGYSTITSVAGCTFMVNGNFTDKATAVTQISEGVNFEKGNFYSYKNGKDQYLLFNLDNSGIVVAVEKGTNFHLNKAEDPTMAVKESDIMGIWFGTDKEGLKLDKGKERCDAHVTAQVVITNDLYNDFIGRMVTLDNGSEEWAMFVGIPGNRYKNMTKKAKEGIDVIADSFVLSNNTGEFQEPEYAVIIDGSTSSENTVPVTSSISGNGVSNNTATANETEVSVVSGDEVLETTVSENDTVSGDEVITEEVEGETEGTEEGEQPEENPEEAPEEPEQQEAEESEQTEQVETSEEQEQTEEAQEEAPEEPEPEEKPETTEERPKAVRTGSTVIEENDDGKAYYSSVYQMLNLGQTGIFDVISKAQTGKPEQMMARLYGIQDSVATRQAIEKAFGMGLSPFAYMAPPAGCHWESVIYAVNYDGINDRPYVNIKLVGADGKALKYRGIKYSMFTHDIYSSTMNGSWKDGMMVYYAVPNGCTEYVLKIGDGDNINGWNAAYYYINRSK